jgi:hypothetical protein
MLQHQDERGRAAYACAAGETHFWRRHPNKVANTLAFLLGRESAEFERVRGAEVEPLRECLQYLRVHNPHLRVYLSNAERFVELYGQLQAVVPRGRAATPVRLHRAPRTSVAAERATLGETLGSETDVLVVVDPAELPRTYATLDILAEQVGQASYRVWPAASNAQSEAGARSTEAPAAAGLSPDWGRAMREAASGMTSRVTFGDPHLDAKLFVYLLPHGTGSCRAEEGAGGLLQYAKSCLLSLDPSFRRSPVWSFFQLDRMIKNDLYFRERGRKARAE